MGMEITVCPEQYIYIYICIAFINAEFEVLQRVFIYLFFNCNDVFLRMLSRILVNPLGNSHKLNFSFSYLAFHLAFLYELGCKFL